MAEVVLSIKSLLKKGFLHVLGGSVLNKIIGFLSSIVLVRILTKAEYGVFTYAWSIYSMVLLANGCGLELGSLQLCSERDADEAYTKTICTYSVKNGLRFNVILLFVLLMIGIFAPLKIEGSNELIIFLCALPMIKILYGIAVSYLRARKRNQDFAKLSVINVFVVFATSSLCAFILREKGMVLGYYIGYIISVIVACFGMKVSLFSASGVVKKEDRKALWSISTVSMFNTGLSELLYLLDTFVLGIVGTDETGIAAYKVATIVPSNLVFIPMAIITFIYPYFAEHRKDGKWCMRTYKRILLFLGSFNLIVSVLLFAMAPWIIRLLYGDGYMDSIPIMRLLAVNYFFSGTFRILSGNLLVTQRKLKFNFCIALVSGLVNALADFLFIQWWGGVGAAIATILVVVITSIANTVYLVSVFKKNSSIERRRCNADKT